jgi:hemerythrin-like domain-containing protein/quercetin dioxygenase-like cupin family protein
MAMNDCCELLIAEHRRAEELMGRLDVLLRQMVASGDPTRPQLPEIQTTYAALSEDLHRHYALEEKALFPILSQYRSMMLLQVEHEDLLTLQNEFAQHLARVTQGEPEYLADSPLLLKRFQAFKDRLFAHILEEERGIFPLANDRLESEEKFKVLRLTNALIEANDPRAYDLDRKTPSFTLEKAKPPTSSYKPMEYQTLFEQEHNIVQTVRLQAGQKQALHWAGQTQFMLVLSGELNFEANGNGHALGAGDTLTIDSRLRFALSAVTEALLIVFKVWPHPHYTKG